jgi:hypothetical protein
MLYLRQHYHFGHGKIADYLKRVHHLSVAMSSVHDILVRHGMNRLPANQKHRPHAKRWQRYEKPQPGHPLQMDVEIPRAHPRHPKTTASVHPPSTTARGFGFSRCTTRASKAPRSDSSMKCSGGYRSGSSSFRRTMGQSFSHAFTGTLTPWTSVCPLFSDMNANRLSLIRDCTSVLTKPAASGRVYRVDTLILRVMQQPAMAQDYR